jgi:hypothetical protein
LAKDVLFGRRERWGGEGRMLGSCAVENKMSIDVGWVNCGVNKYRNTKYFLTNQADRGTNR